MAAGLILPSGLVACSGASSAARPRPRTLRIGWLNPSTGPLGGFGAADDYVLGGIESALTGGVDGQGGTHPVEIVRRDTASDPARAAVLTEELAADGVDLVVAGTTPEMTIPVAATCERLGVPCITTLAPWQAWFFGLDADPMRGLTWAHHFFWGAEDLIAVNLDLWNELETNRRVGALWPDDSDGRALSDPVQGFPPSMDAAGFTLVDPGRYPNLSADFTVQIDDFLTQDAQILAGVPLPPDFRTFWTQAADRGYRPRIATIAKALLFPENVDALGELGEGLSTEVWWSPRFPFTSSLTVESCAAVAQGYVDATGRQWVQTLGYVHAALEVAVDVLRRTRDVDNPESVLAALRATALDTLVGHISWSGRPVPNVAKTPLLGGQWVAGERFPYDLRIVTNKALPDAAIEAAMQPLPVR